MPKPPEKSRKLCDVWRFFPPCPGLFWGLKFLCWNFCWTMHLIHGFTISKLTRGLYNSVFTGIKQYSLLSFKLKKKTTSAHFSLSCTCSLGCRPGAHYQPFPIWRVITVLTLSILQQSSSAKSRIPLAPNRPPTASEGRLEGQRPQPRCVWQGGFFFWKKNNHPFWWNYPGEIIPKP